MRYINIKTGAIIDSPCLISGGDWIEETPKIEKISKTEPKKAKEPTKKGR